MERSSPQMVSFSSAQLLSFSSLKLPLSVLSAQEPRKTSPLLLPGWRLHAFFLSFLVFLVYHVSHASVCGPIWADQEPQVLLVWRVVV